MLKFVLKEGRDKSGKKYFWFTLMAKNGKILMTSETYQRRAGALKGMAASAGINKYVFKENLGS